MLLDRALAPLEITRSQWWVLAFISRQDGLSQTRLARELDVSKVGLGTLLDRLESGGFITRRADPDDRRVKRVHLAPRAQSLLRKLRAETDILNEKIAKGISGEQLRMMSETLLSMKHNLRALTVDDAENNVESVEILKSNVSSYNSRNRRTLRRRQ
jgi:DNA-binding MarR family transcriptional regulator